MDAGRIQDKSLLLKFKSHLTSNPWSLSIVLWDKRILLGMQGMFLAVAFSSKNKELPQEH